MASTLDDILGRLNAMPEADRKIVLKAADKIRAAYKWVPNPGPQADAYFSQADCLLYGGSPGSGKSQLIIGLAFNEHKRSLIMRREYGDLERIIEDALKVHGSKEGFNGSPPPRLRISNEKVINFRAAQRIGDEQGTMGMGRDFLGIDEATHFAESQVRFLMGWVRSEDSNQRCRTVLATNPPLTAEGLWVINMFAPWIDIKYPNPAKPGELRWVVSGPSGDIWVDGPDDAREFEGKVYRPTSRTYIPGSVSDNPEYSRSDYQKTLDAMPAVMREMLMGGFKTSFKDAPNQVIPTEWVRMAQQRWKPTPPNGVPMCAMGVDASGGGDDPMVISPRYDGWFAPLIEIPGREIPVGRIGQHCAGLIVGYRRDNATVIVDMGGGYGGPIFEQLTANDIRPIAHKGAESSHRRTADRKLGFVNRRSEVIWQFREALDPGQPGGSPIALPDDPKLMADLTAPTFDMTPHGIRVEAKDHVCKRLGRSTDHGDAVVMSWAAGTKGILVRSIGQPEQRGPDNFGINAKPNNIIRSPRAERARERMNRR